MDCLTLPDSGTGLARWWAEHRTDDDSWVARTYRELIDRAGPAAERHITTISIALDMKAATRAIRSAGGGLRGAAAVLRQEMHTLTTALGSADLKPAEWLTPERLAIALRSAYDPKSPPHSKAQPPAPTSPCPRRRSTGCFRWSARWPGGAPPFVALLVVVNSDAGRGE